MQNNARRKGAQDARTNQLDVRIGRNTATLTLQGSLTLNAQQIEDLVANLAFVRARMQPQVQRYPPPFGAGRFVLNPRHAVLADPLGESIFTFIRHPMFGWISLAQSQDEAMQMVLALAGQLKLLETESAANWSH
jgi:hypothetical protein